MKKDNSKVLSGPIKFLIFIGVLAAAAYFLMPYITLQLQEELFPDTHIKKIAVEQTIEINNIKYDIISIHSGDHFTVVYYYAKGMSMVPEIRGARLYQNNVELKYVDCASSIGLHCIAFETGNGYENLELRIESISDFTEQVMEFPLDFEYGKMHIDVPLGDTGAKVDIVLHNNSCEIIKTGFTEFEQSRECDNINPVALALLQNGVMLDDYNRDNPPTDLVITIREAVYSGDTVVVPIS